MLSSRTMPQRRDILGIAVSAIDGDKARDLIVSRLDDEALSMVAFLNANNANIAVNDAELRHCLASSLVLPDGLGVDLASLMLYGESFPENLNGTDFVPKLFSAIERPCHVGLIGAQAETLAKSCQSFADRAPQHRFSIIADGYQPDSALPEIMARIAEMRPDFLIVAMGTPRQETWVQQNVRAEHCSVAISVGALFDFMGGAVPRAPLWVRRLRLEWVFRLLQEPSRLWRRYLVGNPVFLLRILRQKLFGWPSSSTPELPETAP